METVHLWSVDKAMSCLQNKALVGKGIPPTPFHLLLLPQYQGVCVSQRGWLSSSPWDTGAGQSGCPLFCPPHLTCRSWSSQLTPWVVMSPNACLADASGATGPEITLLSILSFLRALLPFPDLRLKHLPFSLVSALSQLIPRPVSWASSNAKAPFVEAQTTQHHPRGCLCMNFCQIFFSGSKQHWVF